MADSRISALTELTSLSSSDILPIVDVSDTSMGTGGTTKHALFETLKRDSQTTSLLVDIASSDWTAEYPERDTNFLVTWSTHIEGVPAGTTSQVVHPSVVRIPGGWNGYEYWMCITPYPGGAAAAENPSIMKSVDGNTWIEAGANPKYPKPNGYSVQGDSHLFYDADRNKLIIHYIRDTDGGILRDMCRGESSDGETWESPVVLWTETVAVVSKGTPCLVKLKNSAGETKWRLYYNRYASSSGSMRFIEEDDYLDFDSSSTETTCSFSGSSRMPWDFQIYNWNGHWFLSNAMSFAANGSGAELHFSTSSDGISWTTRRVMGKNSTGNWPDTFVYTTAVEPILTESGLALRAWVSGANSDLTWGIGQTIFRPVTPATPAKLGELVFSCNAPIHASPASGTVSSIARWAQSGLSNATIAGTAATASAAGVTFGTGGTYTWATETWMHRPWTAFLDFTTPATLSGGSGTARLLALIGNTTAGKYMYLYLYNHPTAGWIFIVGHNPSTEQSIVSPMSISTSTNYVVGVSFSGSRVEFAAKNKPEVRDGESLTGGSTTIVIDNSAPLRLWDSSLTGTFKSFHAYNGALSRTDLWNIVDQR